MKKYILIIVALLDIACVSAQNKSFSLSGKLKGTDTGILKIQYLSTEGAMVLDSTVAKNGAFHFQGAVNEPTLAYLSMDVKRMVMDDPNVGKMFISPGTLNIELEEGKFKSLKLYGSKTQEEFTLNEKLKDSLTESAKPLLMELKRIKEAYSEAKKGMRSNSELAALQEKAAMIKAKLEPYNQQRAHIDLTFIKNNPNSYYSAYLLSELLPTLKLTQTEEYFDSFTPIIKSSRYGKRIVSEIKKLMSGSPGSYAQVFSKPDINGENISLADFKGQKYVLLDFWASWCVPCRKGNPHLLGLYNKYKSKGFEIIGISDDDKSPQAWKNAVVADKIGVWKHVLRGLKRTATGYDKSNDITANYGVHSLPTKVLIDKSGIIVGRYGEGGESEEALDRKLADIFGY